MNQVPMADFSNEITFRGVPASAMYIAGGVGIPIILIGQVFVPILILIPLTLALMWYVLIPLGEWLTEKIPPKFFNHLLTWLIQGGHMYATNDSDPIPVVIYDEPLARSENHKMRAR